MAPRTLIQMIEDHGEEIAQRVVRRLRQDPQLRHIPHLPESELRSRALEVIKNFGHWLAPREPQELARRFEQLGKRRSEEAIPLCEVVRALQLLKTSILDYVREQGVGNTYLELYAEEELEHAAGKFFDSAIYHVICGYEGAAHHAAHSA
jgi:hypothetical protein